MGWRHDILVHLYSSWWPSRVSNASTVPMTPSTCTSPMRTSSGLTSRSLSIHAISRARSNIRPIRKFIQFGPPSLSSNLSGSSVVRMSCMILLRCTPSLRSVYWLHLRARSGGGSSVISTDVYGEADPAPTGGPMATGGRTPCTVRRSVRARPTNSINRFRDAIVNFPVQQPSVAMVVTQQLDHPIPRWRKLAPLVEEERNVRPQRRIPQFAQPFHLGHLAAPPRSPLPARYHPGSRSELEERPGQRDARKHRLADYAVNHSRDLEDGSQPPQVIRMLDCSNQPHVVPRVLQPFLGQLAAILVSPLGEQHPVEVGCTLDGPPQRLSVRV